MATWLRQYGPSLWGMGSRELALLSTSYKAPGARLVVRMLPEKLNLDYEHLRYGSSGSRTH